MESFVFQGQTRIIFGRGTETQAGRETAAFSRKVLLHHGGGSIKKSGLYASVCRSLSLVREGISICRKEKIDFILAVGGGSVIDSAKAIGIGVPYSGDVWDFHLRKLKPREMLPVRVVLTISAAGSEASNGSVVTREEGGCTRRGSTRRRSTRQPRPSWMQLQRASSEAPASWEASARSSAPSSALWSWRASTTG
jgi:alcohol dehydrogenase